MQGTLYLTCHTLLKFEIETMNPTNYQKILDNVSGIIADHTERFSIFDMLGQSENLLILLLLPRCLILVANMDWG